VRLNIESRKYYDVIKLKRSSALHQFLVVTISTRVLIIKVMLIVCKTKTIRNHNIHSTTILKKKYHFWFFLKRWSNEPRMG